MGAPLAALVALATAATVSVRSNRGIVIPGTDASAELLVVARDAAPDIRLDLTATAGTVTGVRPLGDGRFQATFTPPQGAPPSIVFVTARVTSGERTDLGHTAIAVHGQATVEAEVAPKETVTIEAGGRDFGPFTADDRGRVRAQLVVPPRLEEVTLRRGSGGDRVLPLQLPPVSLLHAEVPGEASHGHGEAPLEIEVMVVDRTGYPAWKPAPRLSADHGEVTPQGLKAPGVFRWTFEAPGSPASGVARVIARLPDDPASLHALAVRLRAAPAPAAPPLAAVPRHSGVGVEVGLMATARTNRARAHGGTPAAELALRLPSSSVALVLRADWTFYQDVKLALGGSGAEQVVSFGGPGFEAGARFTLELPPWLGIHGWAGLAGRHVDATLRVRGGPANGATERWSGPSLGLATGVGFSLRAGPGRFLVEGGYQSLPAQGGVLRGNLGGLGATAGYLVELR